MKKRQRRTERQKAPEQLSVQEMLCNGYRQMQRKGKILTHARVYLSGPMDFVASRAEERKTGWRSRLRQFLQRQFGTTVYDPWEKPNVVGMPHYGKEDEFSTARRQEWTFADDEEGDRKRAELRAHFWSTMHIDLRMVDTSDFVIAYCPTTVYSVGTVHEIVLARTQCKPVLFVSPPTPLNALAKLRKHLEKNRDKSGQRLVKRLEEEASLRPNPGGIPSLWYMPLIDGCYFFDGFGFAQYMRKFRWEAGPLDKRERQFPPKRPLLPFLESLNSRLPTRYDLEQQRYVENSDWLILHPAR